MVMYGVVFWDKLAWSDHKICTDLILNCLELFFVILINKWCMIHLFSWGQYVWEQYSQEFTIPYKLHLHMYL